MQDKKTLLIARAHINALVLFLPPKKRASDVYKEHVKINNRYGYTGTYAYFMNILKWVESVQ